MKPTEPTSALAERLSGLLRVAFTNAGAAFDLRLERALRDRWLEAHGRAAAPDGSVVGNGGAEPARPQTWKELAGGLPETTIGYAAHERHYRSYLAAVASALGGEAAQPELAHAASAAFRCLQACIVLHCTVCHQPIQPTPGERVLPRCGQSRR